MIKELRATESFLHLMVMLRVGRVCEATLLMQLTKTYGTSLDRAQKEPCGQGKEKVKKGFLEVFYVGVSLAGREKCDQKQREVTLHHSSHPGRAKEEPQGRKGDPPSLLESKKASSTRERRVPKVHLVFYLQDDICDGLVPFFRKSLQIKTTLRLCLLTSISGLRMHTEELL